MDLSILIALISAVGFGIPSIFFSLKSEKTKHELKSLEKKLHSELYEARLFKDIQNRLMTNSSPEKVIEIITGSLENYLPFSVSSGLILTEGKLYFRGQISEPVSASYITEIKSQLKKSLEQSLHTNLPQETSDIISGHALSEKQNTYPLSTLSLPVNFTNTHAIIAISSIKPKLYDEHARIMLESLINLVGNTLKNLESNKKQEASKSNSLINSLEDGLILLSNQNQIELINQPARSLLALNHENPTFIDLLSSLPNTYNFTQKIEQAFSLKQKIIQKAIPLNNKSLNICLIPINPILTPDSTQNPPSALAILIHDITQERAELKMKEDSTHVIVHELRSPLTSIKASSEMLNSQQGLGDEEKKTLTRIIGEQASKMLDEVSTILDAAKIENGAFSLNKSKNDLNKNLTETIDSLRAAIQNKSIHLEVNLDPTIPEFEFDFQQIRRVVANLLNNSLKFTPNGGTISINDNLLPGNPNTSDNPSEKVQIIIKDTGTGINEAKKHLLFSKFSQIENAQAAKGTGLGLYLSKGIIEAHHGSISLESKENQGTTITIVLPTNQLAQKSKTTDSPQQNPQISITHNTN